MTATPNPGWVVLVFDSRWFAPVLQQRGCEVKRSVGCNGACCIDRVGVAEERFCAAITQGCAPPASGAYQCVESSPVVERSAPVYRDQVPILSAPSCPEYEAKRVCC